MNETEAWTADHPRWGELMALVAELGQQRWFEAHHDWHLSSHVLVGLKGDRVVGFLRYVVQPIGVEEGRPPFTLNDVVLREAKVLAFGVSPAERRQGIGRSLQEQLIVECRALGLYQIRSHSGDEHPENHRLKAALGFAIHPLPVGGGKQGVYFILPL